jgi:hypothetical protein
VLEYRTAIFIPESLPARHGGGGAAGANAGALSKELEMRLSSLTPCILAVAALVGGCAHEKPPPNAVPTMVCKDGTSPTENGQCAGHGGVDHQASQQKSGELRERQVSGAAAARSPDEVWATPAAKVYYCHGDPGFGKAKEGQYMSESAAVGKGMHANGGKHCAG